jgi:hypothetical protein
MAHCRRLFLLKHREEGDVNLQQHHARKQPQKNEQKGRSLLSSFRFALSLLAPASNALS